MKANARPMSLTARVILFVGIATSLCLIILGAIVQTSIQHHFAEQDAEELQTVAHAVQEVLQQSNESEPELATALSLAVKGHHGVYFQVADQSGRTIYTTPGADLSSATSIITPVEHIEPSQIQTWSAADRTYRGAVLMIPTGTQNYTVITASDMDFHLHFLSSFQLTLWGIIACAATLTLLAAWFGVHQGHSPLRELSDNIQHIQSDRLHVRLDPGSTPIELQDLVISFNHMLSRLEEGFTRLSNFSADIAHELRTPLMNLMTQTQVGLSKARNPEEYRELMYSNLEEQEKLAKMVGEMLWLAQTDHGLVKPVFASLDLAEEVNALFEYFGAWAEEHQVSLALEGACEHVQGDRSMLRRAISNLLSNAIQHTPEKGVVTVRLSSNNRGYTTFSVQNSGIDIQAEHLPRLFDRFYRVDTTRQRQSESGGLGLAIVKSIIEIHGGKIEVSSAKGITAFTVALLTTVTERNQHVRSARSKVAS